MIVLIEETTDALLQKARSSGVEVVRMGDIEKLGHKARDKMPPLEPMVIFLRFKIFCF